MVIGVKTPSQVTVEIEAVNADKLANKAQERPIVVDNLADYVKKCWGQTKGYRPAAVKRFDNCLRRRKGEYDAIQLDAIKKMGGSQIFMRITGTKCNAAHSWIADIFAPAGDRPWALESTPIPDLPDDIRQELLNTAVEGAQEMGVPLEVMQELVDKHEARILDDMRYEADQRAERMGDQIEDILAEGGFRDELDAFIDDLVTFPCAIFKGPIYTNEVKSIAWAQNGAGEWEPQLKSRLVRKFKRVSPYDFYPSPASVEVGDDWAIERIRYTREDLAALRGIEGYNNEGIAMALVTYREGGLKNWLWDEGERAKLEGRNSYHASQSLIDGLEWSGKIQGQMLLDWGLEGCEVDDPLAEYAVNIIIIGDYVIRCQLNPDPTGKSEYYKASWRPIAGSFYGEALPEVLADCQDACNASMRALVNNMGIASGPMVYYSADRLMPGQDMTKLHPWKLIGTTESRTGSTAIPVGFFQPQSNAQELMAIYERFSRYADDISGIPAYAYGASAGGGAARTASGLSMLMNSASKGIKAVVRTMDRNVIEPLINKLYVHLMLDPEVNAECKGDAQIKARGSEALLHKEVTQQFTQQFLAQTANPIDLEIVGQDGRRELLREVAKQLDIPVDRVIPPKEKVQAEQMAQMQAMAQQGQLGPDGQPLPQDQAQPPQQPQQPGPM